MRLPKLGRAGNVGAFPDVYEKRLWQNRQRFKTSKAARRWNLGRHPRRLSGHSRGHLGNMIRSCAAAASEDVHQIAVSKFLDDACGILRRLVVFSESVGQTRIRVARDEAVRDTGELGKVRSHLLCPQGAVQTDNQGPGMSNRIPEGFDDLTRKRSSRGVGDGAGYHHRPTATAFLEKCLQREDRGLRVKGIKDGLDQE